MGHHIGDGDKEKLTDDPANRIGDQIIHIIKPAPGNQLQIFNTERNQKAGHSRTDAHLGSEPSRDIRQHVSHGHKQHNVHVDLGNIRRIHNLNVRHGFPESLCKEDADHIKNTVINFHCTLKVFIQCDMYLIIP